MSKEYTSGTDTAPAVDEFIQIQTLAAEHGIALPDEVVSAAEKPDSLGEYTFTPTAMLSAVAAAGHMRRRRPHELLVEKKLPATEGDSFLSQTLKEILAAGHDTHDGTGLPTFSYDQKIDTVSACDWADQRVGGVLYRLKDDDPVAHAQIITTDGVPLFVRKGSPGHASAMNIRPFVLNGVLISPGTILRVDTTYDIPQAPLSEQDRQLYGRSLPPDDIRGNEVPWGLTTLDAKDITQVGYGRLSTFALPPEQRTADMLPRLGSMEAIDPKAAEFVCEATMDQVRAIVDRALPYAKAAQKPVEL